jgi:hypothetical protein
VPPSETRAVPLLRRLPLVGLLAGIALAELLLNRVFARLMRYEPLQPRSAAVRLLDGTARFSYELLSVLGTVLLAAALLRIALSPLYRFGARVAFPLVGVVAVALATLSVLVVLPPALLFHLHLSFFFLCLLVLLAVGFSPVEARVKVATVLLVVAYLLRLLPSAIERFVVVPSVLGHSDVEQAMLILASVAALLLVPPRSRSHWAAPVSWVLICGAALLMRLDWETARRVAAHAFALDLPLSPWGQATHLLALGFVSNAVLRLVERPGTDRLRGYGLALIALGGLQTYPPYLSLAVLGLLCLADSSLRPDGRALPREAFEPIVRAGAAAVSSAQVSVTGRAGWETVRFHSPATAPVRVEVQLQRRAGVVRAVDVMVGPPDAAPRDPALTVERKEARGLGPRAAGATVLTDDPTFDRAFVVRDRRSLGARLLDEATRARMLEHVAGWLAVWPEGALRYRATGLGGDTQALAALLTFLVELAARAA